MSAQWKGALTGSGTARRMPCSGASFTARSIAAFRPADHDLSRRVIVRDLGNLTLCGCRGKTFRLLDLGAEKGQHGPLPWRHGFLHGLPAQAQKFRGFGYGEHAGCGKRRIFAERMARHECRLERVCAIFLAKRRVGGQRNCHERRLRIRRERQGRFRPFPHDARKVVAERLVNLFEHVARNCEPLREALPHANGLAALPGKCECKCHAARVVTRAVNEGVMTA